MQAYDGARDGGLFWQPLFSLKFSGGFASGERHGRPATRRGDRVPFVAVFFFCLKRKFLVASLRGRTSRLSSHHPLHIPVVHLFACPGVR